MSDELRQLLQQVLDFTDSDNMSIYPLTPAQLEARRVIRAEAVRLLDA